MKKSIIGLVGEVGVGKTQFAEYIHALIHPPKAQMLTIDCSWLTENTLNLPQLEAAPTILILHIEVLNPEQQEQLVERVQKQCADSEEQYTIFIEITASQYLRSIPDAIAHLATLLIFIEPLRKHLTQTVRVFRHLLDMDNKKSSMTDEVEQQLVNCQWNGNMTELLHTYTHSKDLPENQGEILQTIDLFHFEQSQQPLHLRDALSNYRKKYVESMLRRYDGNQTRTAKALNIQRTYLNKLLNTWYKNSNSR